VNSQSEYEEVEESDGEGREIYAEEDMKGSNVTETHEMPTGKGKGVLGGLVAGKGVTPSGFPDTRGKQSSKDKGKGIRNNSVPSKNNPASECADTNKTQIGKGKGKGKGFLGGLVSGTETITTEITETREIQTSKGEEKGFLDSLVSVKEVIVSDIIGRKEWHPHHSVCVPAYSNHSWAARRKRDQLAQLQS